MRTSPTSLLCLFAFAGVLHGICNPPAVIGASEKIAGPKDAPLRLEVLRADVRVPLRHEALARVR